MKKLIIPIIVSLLVFTGCNKNNKDANGQSNNKYVNVVVNQNTSMKIDYSIMSNKDILISVLNLHNETLKYGNIDIAMFDKNNKLVKVQKEFVRNLDVNSENVFRVFLNNDENIKRIEITSYPVEVEESNDVYYTSEVIGEINEVEPGKLVATIKNNSGVVLDDVSASIVIYKDDKMEDGITVSIQNLESEYQQEFYLNATDNKGNITYMEYDEAKVIINYAYKMN